MLMQCFLLGQMQALPVTVDRLQMATRRDPILSKVLQYTRTRWPLHVPEPLNPFLRRKEELSVENGCILWGTRVIIPSSLCSQVQDQLHQDHCGIARMKAIARSYLWWPGLDQDLETVAKSCQQCCVTKGTPPELQCTHGFGQMPPGNVSTLILLAHSCIKCSW